MKKRVWFISVRHIWKCRPGFIKLSYAYHQWYANNCLTVHGLCKKKNRRIKKLKWWNPDTDHMHTHKRWVHAVRISSCLTKRVTIIFLIAAVQRNSGLRDCAWNNYWWYVECVRSHTVVRQLKSMRTPGVDKTAFAITVYPRHNASARGQLSRVVSYSPSM
jgi:hypothetical protein